MRKHIITVFFFYLLSNTLPSFSQVNTARLDSLLNQLQSKDKAMGSVSISRKGELLYSKAFGFSRMEASIIKYPSDTATKYRIGSISKMFTMVMIMQLIEEKKLKLSTPLSQFYPKVPNAKEITIKQLLNHHSGLHNFTSDESYASWMNLPKTKEEMLELIYSQKPDFKPGEKGDYSNTNFVLLGFIIEKLTQSTYAAQLEKRITSPLGLKNTYYGSKINTAKNEAQSYSWTGKWTEQSQTDMSIPHGAGAIVSTPADLNKFIYALFQNKLISKASVKEVTDLTDSYGLGIFRVPFYDRFAYGHNGGIDGFVSSLAYFPDDSTALSVTFNGMNHSMNDILIGVLSIYYNKPYVIPSFESVTLDPEKLSAYEGVYAAPGFPLKITIKKDGSVLTAQATGQSAFPLEATDELSFSFAAAGIRIVFIKEADGKINRFNFSQGGARYVFSKE
jgi:D-alanyl-D-alanine carboxypeptidase